MKLFKYNEIEIVTVDENFDNDSYSDDVDNALNRGYDQSFPIVIDEDGLIIDGNHRFSAFKNANRMDEVVFCVVNYFDYSDLVSSLIDQNLNEKFNKDNEFFYEQIKQIAK
jgi:hypothetical protein